MLRLITSTSLSVAAMLLALTTPSQADIINLGFETGDFTGWSATSGGPCTVVAGGASTGTYYAKEYVANNDSAEIKQTYFVPFDATVFSVDVRWLGAAGVGFAHTATLTPISNPSAAVDLLAGTKVDLAALWDRYTVYITAFRNQQVEVKFAVTAGNYGTMEQHIDNVGVPEPSCLVLVGLGGAAVAWRRRRLTA